MIRDRESGIRCGDTAPWCRMTGRRRMGKEAVRAPGIRDQELAPGAGSREPEAETGEREVGSALRSGRWKLATANWKLEDRRVLHYPLFVMF